MTAPRELTMVVLHTIQRTCDVAGNVTMLRLVEAIATDLAETPHLLCEHSDGSV